MLRKSYSIVAGRLIALGLLLAACAPQPPTAALPPATQAPAATQPPQETPIPVSAATTLTDSLGREVTLASAPTRIVSLAPSNTEILFAIGAGDLLVGRDDFSDYPPAALDVPSIGSLYPSVNAEVIVDLEPDLVLAAGITNPADVELLANLGLTVYATSFAVNLDDIYADILALGTLTGRDAQAAAVVADMQARVTAITGQSASITERPLVFYEIDATEPSRPWTAGPDTFVDQLISMAGGENAGNIASDQYAQLSLEQLVAQDPDIIVLGSATYGGQTPALVAQRAGWDGLSAVRSGTVHAFDDNLVTRPGPRIVEGLEALARLIHPDIFQ
jgi:iron complex transport system substrate-binding protein